MPDRVMLLAIDGLDGGRVRALVEAGRCPALARLLREGAYADVAVTSCTPGLADPNRAMNSPTLWTTVATGQHYFQHGVHDFSNMLDSIEHPPLFESRHVQSPRIWDVLSSRGLAGVVVGYYVTHPAYPITGVMVSDLFGETDEAGVVSPPALLGELVGVLGADGYAAYRARLGTLGAEQTMRDTPVPSSNDDAMSLTRDVLRRFADLTEQQAASLLGDEGLKSVLRLLEHRLVYPYLRDDRMHRMFLHLVKSMDWRFAVCYYRIIDFVSHGFLGGAPGLPADFRQPFNRTLDHAYECVD
ncbi:MAG TPA: alkaline phosphatase family protein, partial [Phycisphaerae bacterium]|nr:alkaline phosphatase family protein [Phycisphaerae bacterium]